MEDNQFNREIAVEILNMLNLEVVTAEDGIEAVEYFAESVPGFYDIILMDIQMPRMNGYEAASAAGMNEHISKPISIERLVQVLGYFLGE